MFIHNAILIHAIKTRAICIVYMQPRYRGAKMHKSTENPYWFMGAHAPTAQKIIFKMSKNLKEKCGYTDILCYHKKLHEKNTFL